jgi:CheY-like chemotaxis protein
MSWPAFCPTACPLNGTILLAEEEAITRKNIGEVLQDAGYQVHEATDGSTALIARDRGF